MGGIAVLGDPDRIQALAIAGAQPYPVRTAAEAASAWSGLAEGVAVLIITPDAARALAGRLDERRDLLIAVMP